MDKIPTYIKGLDEVLFGGIPKGRMMLLKGASGTGKTLTGVNFLCKGAANGEPGVFVSCEEDTEDLIENVKSFCDLKKLIKEDKIRVIDASRRWITDLADTQTEYGLGMVIEDIKKAVEEIGAKKVVIDPGAVLLLQFKNIIAIRRGLHKLRDAVKEMGCTSIFTMERPEDIRTSEWKDIENFVLDGVIVLGTKAGRNQIIRTLEVKKMKGTDYRSGVIEFEIINGGLEIFPKFPVDRSMVKTDFKIREKFGVTALDDLLGGGIPQGHMMMISGDTGTGKTTLALHFMVEGLKSGENCVWIALEEPVLQIKKIALEHNWDLTAYEKQGKLKFVDAPLIDASTDKLLYPILNAVNGIGAKRVVIDSISTLESATPEEDKVRELWIQLSTFFKTIGVTCVVNYTSPEMFGAEKKQFFSGRKTTEPRISSLMDAIIVLKYVEREQSVRKLLNVLKLRGSKHSKDIFEFEIDKDGFKLGEKFKI